jgi:8-oxo-dGTP pyrophosphatase MutT (NUDIX family)
MAETDPIIQSGVIPYRIDGDSMQVLLVTSSSGSRWVVPKGNLEPDLTPQQSAIKEAYEEAGIIGIVESLPIGSFEYFKRARRRVVDLYPMEVGTVLESWPEQARRKRQWVSLERAADLIEYDRLVQCIARLQRCLNLQLAADRAA